MDCVRLTEEQIAKGTVRLVLADITVREAKGEDCAKLNVSASSVTGDTRSSTCG